MKERRKKVMKRLLFEELERRRMLAGGPPQIAMASTGLTTNSYEDFYKAQVGTEIGGPAGVGMVDTTPYHVASTFRKAADNAINPITPFADNDTGVGQMTLTTGANTLGIGSFAMPTAGPSRAGGTGMMAGGPMWGGGLGKSEQDATDAAIEQLFTEPEGLADSDAQDDEPAQVSDRPTSEVRTGRRSFGLDTEDADEPETAPAGAGR